MGKKYEGIQQKSQCLECSGKHCTSYTTIGQRYFGASIDGRFDRMITTSVRPLSLNFLSDVLSTDKIQTLFDSVFTSANKRVVILVKEYFRLFLYEKRLNQSPIQRGYKKRLSKER